MSARIYTDTEVCLKVADPNEVLYDEDRHFLHRISASKISLAENSYQEVLRSISKCQDVLLMCIKQQIIMNEKTVRFYHKNDVSGLESKIAGMRLTREINDALKELSVNGYQCLKDTGLLDHLVEFDAERICKVVAFDKILIMAGKFDMLALADEELLIRKRTISQQYQTSKTNTKTSNKKSSSRKLVTNSDSNFDDIDSEEFDDPKTESEATFSSGRLGRAAVTVVFTARSQVPVVELFRQLLYAYLHKLSKFYILAFHVGPLVETQELVLYEYQIPKQLVKFIKQASKQQEINPTNCFKQTETDIHIEKFQVSLTVKKSKALAPTEPRIPEAPNSINVNKLEAEFRKIKGRQIYKLSPLKDYFRYFIHDCPGVKDHYEVNKERYNRYLAKKEAKKEKKRLAKLEKQMEKEKERQAEADGLATERDVTSEIFTEMSKFGEYGSASPRRNPDIESVLGECGRSVKLEP